MLEELRKLCKENRDGHNHTKMSLERLEQAIANIKDQLGEHEERIGIIEERIGMAVNTGVRQQRALRVLLHWEMTYKQTETKQHEHLPSPKSHKVIKQLKKERYTGQMPVSGTTGA